MPFQTERSSLESGVEVFGLSGTLTMGSQLQSLEWALEDSGKKQQSRIVLDMSKVSYIDSSAIGVLVASSGVVERAGGSIRLAGVSDRVLSILKMTGVDTILHFDDTRDAAVAALAATSGQA